MRSGPLGGTFGGGGGNVAAVGRAKRRVEEVRGVVEGESFMVAELSCAEPGCLPVETWISVLGGEDVRRGKLHRPVGEFTREDVERPLINDSKLLVNGGEEGA